MLFSSYTAMGNILSPLFDPYGYTPTTVSIIGGVFIIFGVTGALVAGCILD